MANQHKELYGFPSIFQWNNTKMQEYRANVNAWKNMCDLYIILSENNVI